MTKEPPAWALNHEKAPETPIQRFVFVKDMDDDQLRLLAREKLSEALQAINPVHQPELTRKLCAEVKDRLDGKPGQAITLDANIRTVTVNANIEFVQPNRERLVNPTPAIGQVIDNE
jgi:hypothetical protein